MNRPFSSGFRMVAFLCLLMALCTGAASANDLIFRPVNGGLQMALSTNGYQFHVGSGVISTTAKAKARRSGWLPIGNLVASVVLTNRGTVAVPFTFLDEAAAERKFRFKVFNEEGTQVWESEADAAEVQEGGAVVQTLVKRSPWRRTVQVPLHVDGGWLPSGRYTLEAAVDAEGGPGATAVFEVVNQTVPGIPPTPNTGIKGRVVTSSIWTVSSTPTLLPPTKDIPVRAYVTVQEIVPPNARMIRAPYSWSGFTDAQGNFTAPTISGRFKVTASLSNLLPPTPTARVMPPVDEWPNRPATIEVEVPAGQYVDALLRIGRGPVIVFQANVYSVEEVRVANLPTTTPGQRMLRITADGTVNSGGWSNGQLVQRRSIPWLPLESERLLPMPVDVLEFDFVATPPKGPATTVMSPITATKDVVVPEGIREIRVYSKTNSQSVALPQEL